MINAVARAGGLAPYLRGCSASVVCSARASAPAVPSGPAPPSQAPQPRAFTLQSMHAALPGPRLAVKSGPAVTTQIRYAHTDVSIPDFSHYRRPDTVDPNKKNDSHEARTGFTYLIAGAGAISTVYGAKCTVHYLVKYLSASADVLALAKIEVNLSSIPEGKSVTFKWRGKPLFIRHRTKEEITREESVSPSSLRDPEHDSVRVKDPKWLIVLGVCTHLGCVPIANAGDFGGYYCPCHGSHYDASGRIRKGPAPLNLEVPPYIFNSDGSEIVVG